MIASKYDKAKRIANYLPGIPFGPKVPLIEGLVLFKRKRKWFCLTLVSFHSWESRKSRISFDTINSYKQMIVILF